jgi:O-antigen/teichoic acid export membrane protein
VEVSVTATNPEIDTVSIIDRRSGFAVAGAILFANLCNYGFQILTGRLLSVEEYGLLAGFMAAITIITVGTSALQTTAARAIAAGENHPEQHSLVDGLTKSAGVGAIIVGAFIAVFAPVLSRFLNIGALPILILGVYVLPSSLDSIAAGRLQGTKRFRALAIYSAGQAIAKLAIAATVIAVGLRVSGLLAGLVASSGAIALWGMLRSRDAGAINTHVLSPEMRLNFGALLLFWVVLSIDIAFARAFFEPKAAGVYAAATVLGKAVLWLPTMLTQLLFPQLADRSARSQGARPLMKRAVILVVALASAAVFGLYLLGGPIFLVLYGSRYNGASDIAWKIGLAMVPLAIVNLLLFHFLAKGQKGFLIWMGIAAVGEVLALYLGPKSGTGYAVIVGATGLLLLAFITPRTAWQRSSIVAPGAG